MSDAIQKIARNALKDLADAELEKQMIHLFINQLSSLDHESRQRMVDASLDISKQVRVISTFALDAATRGHLTRIIHEHLVEGVAVEYAESSELLCGIALTVGDQQLDWNLADYLQQLSQHFEEALASAVPAASIDVVQPRN